MENNVTQECLSCFDSVLPTVDADSAASQINRYTYAQKMASFSTAWIALFFLFCTSGQVDAGRQGQMDMSSSSNCQDQPPQYVIDQMTITLGTIDSHGQVCKARDLERITDKYGGRIGELVQHTNVCDEDSSEIPNARNCDIHWGYRVDMSNVKRGVISYGYCCDDDNRCNIGKTITLTSQDGLTLDSTVNLRVKANDKDDPQNQLEEIGMFKRSFVDLRSMCAQQASGGDLLTDSTCDSGQNPQLDITYSVQCHQIPGRPCPIRCQFCLCPDYFDYVVLNNQPKCVDNRPCPYNSNDPNDCTRCVDERCEAPSGKDQSQMRCPVNSQCQQNGYGQMTCQCLPGYVKQSAIECVRAETMMNPTRCWAGQDSDCTNPQTTEAPCAPTTTTTTTMSTTTTMVPTTTSTTTTPTTTTTTTPSTTTTTTPTTTTSTTTTTTPTTTTTTTPTTTTTTPTPTTTTTTTPTTTTTSTTTTTPTTTTTTTPTTTTTTTPAPTTTTSTTTTTPTTTTTTTPTTTTTTTTPTTTTTTTPSTTTSTTTTTTTPTTTTSTTTTTPYTEATTFPTTQATQPPPTIPPPDRLTECEAEGECMSDEQHRCQWCYYFSPDKATWRSAEMFCRLRGGHLAKGIVRPQWEYMRYWAANVTDQNTMFWLGLHFLKSDNVDGHWRWVIDLRKAIKNSNNADLLSAQDIGATNTLALDRCVAFNGINQFNALDCDQEYNFACMRHSYTNPYLLASMGELLTQANKDKSNIAYPSGSFMVRKKK